MAKLIEVEERDLNFIFGKSKPYSLDVYQRDYRWSDTKDHKIVSQLLQDIEIHFSNNMKRNRQHKENDLTEILQDVEKHFKAYFLNTIMLNEQGGTIYIVDGQQRLTTLLLILIKLYRLGIDNPDGLLNVQKILGEKIYEEDMAGNPTFKISNEDRDTIIQKIFRKEPIEKEDITNITQFNLSNNYTIISKYYDRFLTKEDGSLNATKYNYYVYNLLLKVLIIEQVIKHKEDVAMIFETANDRGKELEPHEVLKGMLLGVLENKPKEECNTIWNTALQTFFKKHESYEQVDEFFRTYFRAKYANNKTQYASFSGKYHRNLLTNDGIAKDLDRTKPKEIEQFIKNEFVYFYDTYLEIWDIARSNENIYVTSNYANEQGQQFLLILSALKYKDPEKEKKIALVAKKLDQFYTISRLIGKYDSNEHQLAIYEFNEAIRNKTCDKIETEFERIAVEFFKKKDIVLNKFNDIFEYKYFEKAKIDGRFTKYVLARVDRYLSEILNESSFAKQHTLYYITHSGSRPKNGFHIEHIYSHNEKIINQFVDKEGEPDEKIFNDERNRLGALLLLKGNENIRQSNHVYRRKKKAYSNSGFLWNQILTDSINKASIRSCDDDIVNEFESYQANDKGLLEVEVIDERQKLLFKLIQKIYAN